MNHLAMIIITKIKDWFNKHLNVLLYVLIVLVCSMIAYSLFSHNEGNIKPQTIVDYKEVQLWKDKYDVEHATLEQTQLDKKQFENQVDSISKLLKVKPKNIASVTSITSKGEYKIKDSLIYVDSLNAFTFNKSTNYYSLSGIIKRDSFSKTFKQIEVSLGTLDTLNIVPFTKRTFFKETFAVDVSNKNPYNHIVSGYSYAESQRIKRFGIGPVVSYDPFNNRVSIGIGVQYNIIRF